MPRNLRRHYGKGDLHFITFSCYERRPLLETARARNLFVKVMGEVRERYGFMLVGYVLMPEHVHLLMSEPKKGTPSKVVQVLKQRVSRAMRGKKRRGSPAQLSLRFPNEVGGLRRFWQKRFYDFNVWSGKKLKEKLEYMHANPMQRKLVRHPRESPWSSWGFYVNGDSGLVKMDPMDWQDEAEKRWKERPTLSQTKNERVGHPGKKRQIQNRFCEFKVWHPPSVNVVSRSASPYAWVVASPFWSVTLDLRPR